MNEIQKATIEVGATEREEAAPELPNLGEWYRVPFLNCREETLLGNLGCVTDIGSNYVEITFIAEEGHHRSTRVHYSDFDKLVPANGQQLVRNRLQENNSRIRELSGEVTQLMRKFGFTPQTQLDSGSGTGSIVLASDSGKQAKGYIDQLVLAKETTLPALFADIKNLNKENSALMMAPALELQAQVGDLKPLVKRIEGRIQQVSLYAGFEEEAVRVREGKAATIETPITMHQQRLYMDEECAAMYEAGGMQFADLAEFDAWLSRPSNFTRLFPFERSVVAFRVRRSSKNEQHKGSTLASWVAMAFEDNRADFRTYFYARNGEQLWRVSSKGFDFGEKLFPDERLLQYTGERYGHNRWDEWKFITKHDYDVEKERYDREMAVYEPLEAQYDALVAPLEAKYTIDGVLDSNYIIGAQSVLKVRFPDPKAFEVVSDEYVKRLQDELEQAWESFLKELKALPMKRPEPPSSFRYADYEPFNESSTYYDDMLQAQADERERHNRLVLILQGLLDRSQVFFPHPEWQLWTEAGFKYGLKLQFDGDFALAPGAKPSVKKFFERMSKGIEVGSKVVGVRHFWLHKEQEKHDEEMSRGMYNHYRSRGVQWETEGPDAVMTVTKMSRDHKYVIAEFPRSREYYKRPTWGVKGGHTKAESTGTIKVPVELLINLDNYTAGDYKEFFNDPRTRQDYLAWAPWLFAAEDAVKGLTPKQLGRKDHAPEVDRLMWFINGEKK